MTPKQQKTTIEQFFLDEVEIGNEKEQTLYRNAVSSNDTEALTRLKNKAKVRRNKAIKWLALNL